MDLSALLDQVIRSGKELVETAESKGRDLASSGNSAFEEFAEEKLGIDAQSDAGTAAKGAAAGWLTRPFRIGRQIKLVTQVLPAYLWVS